MGRRPRREDVVDAELSQTNPTEGQTPTRGEGGSTVYWEYVKEQVAREAERKESLEKRALSVITTSGVLASLIFALAAFNITKAHPTLGSSAKHALAVGLVAFFVAAVLALAANRPVPYREIKPTELKDAINSERWLESKQVAEKRTALTEIDVLSSARHRNGWKARTLWTAIAAEVVAIGAIATAAWIIL